MRKILGISFMVQAAFLLGVLAILVRYSGSGDIYLLHEKPSTTLYLIISFGLIAAIAAIGYLFSKLEIKNDGKLSMLVAQAFLSTLFILHGSFDLIVLVVPVFFFAFKFWREP